MPILKNLKKETKIFLFYVVIKNMLKGITIEHFKKSVENYNRIEKNRKYNFIHKKLVDKQMISPEELDFLVDFVKKNQWNDFKK